MNTPIKKTSLILTLFVCLTFASGAAAQTGGTWQTLAPMPTARQELATAALNGKIYAIGGYDSSGTPTNIVEVYDPATNTWSSAHPIPFPLHHNSAAVAAGKLYSFGGPSTLAFVYDELNDSWSPVASMLFFHALTLLLAYLMTKSMLPEVPTAAGETAWRTQSKSMTQSQTPGPLCIR